MRTKIIAGNLAAVLVVGLVSYAMVKSSLESALVAEVDSRIGSDFQLLQRSFRLSARELAELVEQQADQQAVADVFLTTLDEASRRTRAYEAADRTAAWLQDPGRRGGAPDIVAVIDDRGLVVARNADRNRMYQQDLRTVAAVARALQGETATGIWQKEDEQKVLQIAVAPIVHQGRILGAVLVGYDVSNALARSEGELLGRDVAFVLGDRVYSSSLEQGAESEALRGHLFGDVQGSTQGALQQGATSAPFQVQIGDDQYVGVVGPAPGAEGGGTQLAMVVLADRSAQAAKASATNVILMLTVLGALIVLVYGFLIGTSFIRPIEMMEEGILAVINGRTDLRIDLQSQEYGGLVYRINQLLNVFTGTPEEDAEGRVSAPPGQRWDEGEAAGAPAPAAAAPSAAAAAAGEAEEPEDPALAARLAAEPEDAYYARVYAEYVAAKQAAGEDVSNIPQDKFVQRLKANEQNLIKKHNCRMVRFQVQTRGTQVNLKPVVIR